MIAFHSKQEIKEKYLARVRTHRQADQIIKGKYWENGKGCAVGCTIHSSDHSVYETELGIPRILARLEDGIFEALPNDIAMKWPEQFLEAITPGKDLSLIWPKFALCLLIDPEFGVIKFAKNEETKQSVLNISDLYNRTIQGEQIKISVWRAAAYSAAGAAAYASRAATYADAYAAAAAADAAYAAAYAADTYAAGAAAYASRAATYADAYAADDAGMEFRITQSEKLLELLRTA